MAIHILGIRHHGPGSAKNVKAFLENLQPDIVLVEGPTEADGLLQYANHPALVPPVAILAYQTDNIQQSVYYPFAEFSPEWQAIQYAKRVNIHVRFMDLPLTHWFAIESAKNKESENDSTVIEDNSAEVNETTLQFHRNPLQHLADAAGFTSEERWWESMFEHRQNNEEVFTAISEAMQALRESNPSTTDYREQLREASMRKTIRQAEKEMFQNIAVICGAWHVPALTNMPKAKEDNELLKNLPKVKIETTWIPWTYSRLSMFSGYGAGIESPGWYDHVWKNPADDGTLWMTKVAHLFRKNQMDTSVAHVIEAVRLAESLSSLRHLSKVGLEELNEATLSVLCNGESILLALIKSELIVSNRIGTVPEDIPKPPLQMDIEKYQKRLRLPATADLKDYALDLRKEGDLERSIFLHRLLLMGIEWGSKTVVNGKGTFKEQWRLQWNPSFVVHIIEKGVWGNTLEEASNAWLIQKCNQETALKPIAEMLKDVIPADLSGAAKVVAVRILDVAAATNDVIQLVGILPGLIEIMRYGNVRNTDAEMVRQIAESIITRVCIGLPAACCGINEETATTLTEDCISISHSIKTLQEEDYTKQWTDCLIKVAYLTNAAPMMRGFATRQLFDAKNLPEADLDNLFFSNLSRSLPVAEVAAWLEGFLRSSGTLLLIDENLWQMVNNWVCQLEEENFIEALPLLRRTFSKFTSVERRKLGEKVKNGDKVNPLARVEENSFDRERGKLGIPVVMELLGY